MKGVTTIIPGGAAGTPPPTTTYVNAPNNNAVAVGWSVKRSIALDKDLQLPDVAQGGGWQACLHQPIGHRLAVCPGNRTVPSGLRQSRKVRGARAGMAQQHQHHGS